MPRRFTEEKRKEFNELSCKNYYGDNSTTVSIKLARIADYEEIELIAKDAIADLDEANARLEKAKELLEEWAQPPEIPYPYNKYVDRQTRTKAFLAEEKEKPKQPYILCPKCRTKLGNDTIQTETLSSELAYWKNIQCPKCGAELFYNWQSLRAGFKVLPEPKQECSCWLKENFNDMVLIETQSQKTGEWLLRFKPFSGFKKGGK